MNDYLRMKADIPENVREAVERGREWLAMGIRSDWGPDDVKTLCDYIDPPPKTYRIEGELSEEEVERLETLHLDWTLRGPAFDLAMRLQGMVMEGSDE